MEAPSSKQSKVAKYRANNNAYRIVQGIVLFVLVLLFFFLGYRAFQSFAQSYTPPSGELDLDPGIFAK